MNAPTILSLDTETAPLETAGGKGASLARLAHAGFPVPPGFILTTDAYDAFVTANGLADAVLEAVHRTSSDDPRALALAAEAIRSRFADGQVPSPLVRALTNAYAALGRPPVAVRSSATAEDLPGASFAGQHDTFLNVVGDEALLEAVVNCWSSLWTARAIGYRARNGIPHEGLSLAVIVQELISGEASGVLFTANPLSGRRTEAVIDATLGLGEALVSGRVEPDRYVVDAAGMRILGKTLGSKALSVRAQRGGGTVTTVQDAAGQQALPDDAIVELAQLGHRVADLFGTPQDIEWTRADGNVFLLQSRPITSLYPLPEGVASRSFRIMLSFGSVQGILDPITPIGQDALRAAVAGAARPFGYRYTLETQPILEVAAERLFIDFTPVVCNRIGRWLVFQVLEAVEPGAARALEKLREDGHLPPAGRLRFRTVLRLARALAPAVAQAILVLLRPEAERARLQKQLEAAVARVERQSASAKTLAERVALARGALDWTFGFVLPRFVPRFGMGMATLNLLHHLAASLPGDGHNALAMTRGLPHNVTTEMNLALWRTAQTIRADPDAAARFAQADARTLTAGYLAGSLPEQAQQAIAGFLHTYGVRGLGEIDLGRPRWREDPTPVMQVLQGYLQIESEDRAPDVVFERKRLAAEAEIRRLEQETRRADGGWLKAPLVRWAARRMRALAGLRESPKFTMVRIMGIVRGALLESGRALVESGQLAQPADLVFLYLSELDALAAGERRDWRALVRQRRQSYDRERLRRQIPRLLLSDGQAFYEGLVTPAEDRGTAISGSPVSPGVAEGVVHVVLDPRGAHLAPGEILVCPGTDPSWTPLFLSAGGLVMEVGGLMTHGSVVAREYGIPAIVGVHQATQRLKTGQRVQIDGTAGTIVVLEDS